MRWSALIIACAVASTALADPDPKKYKPESKEKQANAALTDEERKFLREVEAKFGVKSDVPLEVDPKETDIKENTKVPSGLPLKLPFPAVVAIEIVNDTDAKDTKTKGKRTIDANLGYGYRTNSGYTYSYFGKPNQEKGKFMIYPYSQEDIPAASGSKSSSQDGPSVVEIQPSQAYELVPVKDEPQQTSYEYKKPETEFNTGYEKVQGQEAPPPQYPGSGSPASNTLYTTYNGEQFSGLQGNFPQVMSNYLVDSSQLLQNPQYQSAGLTQDHLNPHGQQLTDKRVVPVLVLRIPSSYLKNPSAELYADLPQNYPLSNYLNNVNLQELVNQYFKKIGYSNAPPQITTYQGQGQSANSASVQTQEPQQYSSPYGSPSYTQSDYSGVQYSAVQPTIAKYPSQTYQRPQYSSQQQSYQKPQQQYQYSYQSQYQPQTATKAQSYYSQPQTQYVHEQPASSAESQPESISHVEYGTSHETPETTVVEQYEIAHGSEYQQPQQQQQSYSEYEAPKEQIEYNSGEVPPKPAEEYTAELTQTQTQDFYHRLQGQAQPETIVYPSYPSQEIQKYFLSGENSGASQSFIYQKQVNDDSASKTVIISENYPSKDHTQAHPYKPSRKPTEALQTVNYVTPLPYTAHKYHSQYKVMSPQTVLKNPEQVSYVNSHSLPMHYLNSGETFNPEEEYTLSHRHVVPIGNQKSSYPKNYHSHPKRMASKDKPDPPPRIIKKSAKIEQKKST